MIIGLMAIILIFYWRIDPLLVGVVFMEVNSKVWRVEGDYCTYCHEEGDHNDDCIFIALNKGGEDE